MKSLPKLLKLSARPLAMLLLSGGFALSPFHVSAQMPMPPAPAPMTPQKAVPAPMEPIEGEMGQMDSMPPPAAGMKGKAMKPMGCCGMSMGKPMPEAACRMTRWVVWLAVEWLP